MSLDPQEFTVPELEGALEAVDDAAELETILTREEAGENRKTAKAAIEARQADAAEAADDDADAESEAGEPEPEDDTPSPSYPDADSDERVIYDPSGAGEGATYGHETIHLTDDGRTPRCGASVGAKAQPALRSDLPENIDECTACP